MYQALYRKYRPATFDDVISQPHITETLRNQIANGRTAHAYIFTGSRGTGKTTCARILAKAMICENPQNGEPCLECGCCVDMEKGRLGDVIEIDAASYGGVDDARELREEASYTPERCRYRIYIIDEVHMLSKEAFNALLKLIEEPPPHIKFIMATTEIHKVLPTILSRCQRFDFRRIRPEDIAARLLYVAGKENISLDDDAAALIARTADGGMRDALSILDRCVAFTDRITAEAAAEAAGIAGRESVIRLAEALADKNAADALKIIGELYSQSKDMSRLCMELIEQLRNMMILKTIPGSDDLIAAMPDDINRLRAAAERNPLEHILASADALGRCSAKLSSCMSQRTELELTAIGICADVSSVSASAVPAASSEETMALRSRITALEGQLRGILAGNARQFTEPNRPERYPIDKVTANVSESDKPVPMPQWAEISERFAVVCPPVSAAMKGSMGYELGDKILVAAENPFFAQLLRNKENYIKLMETVHDITGKKYRIYAKTVPVPSGGADNRVPALLQKAESANIPVETVN